MEVDQTLFEKELRDILGELADTVSIETVTIVASGEPLAANDEELGEIVPLGNGARLYVQFKNRETHRDSQQHAAALERAARAIRACARRWDKGDLPRLSIQSTTSVTNERLIARIETYLRALCAAQNIVNCTVTLHDDVVASASALTELHRERIPFILKQLAAEVDRNRGDSSHAVIVGDDFLASTFWFGAALVTFFDGPVSIDFLRHRSRMVIRELAGILPSFDDPPRDPAKVEPVPE